MIRGSIQFKVNVLPVDDMVEVPAVPKKQLIQQIIEDFKLLLEETIEEGVGVSGYGPMLVEAPRSEHG